MRKIPTIFKRDPDTGKVINEPAINFDFANAIATEKLDGTNIRLTIRNNIVVRVEKRRNPTREQKNQGILEPWYIDAHRDDPNDKWIFDAVDNTEYSLILDGEWSAEAIGKNIQGNPLNLDRNIVFIFSDSLLLRTLAIKEFPPTTYDELKEWLPKQKSLVGNDCGIEGIVWHHHNGMAKIKVRDFI
jgi:hypothetical protein